MNNPAVNVSLMRFINIRKYFAPINVNYLKHFLYRRLLQLQPGNGFLLFYSFFPIMKSQYPAGQGMLTGNI